MKAERQSEILRAYVKVALREKGLRFNNNLFSTDLSLEVKKFNNENRLSTPLTELEFCELYLEIMRELVAEHFAMIEKKIAEAQLDNEHFRDDPR